MYDYFMEELVWQMFILGCGEHLEEALKKGLGGVIFFTKDIHNEVQFKNLIFDINSKAIIKPFLSIDQEGGRVERSENIRPRRLSASLAFQKGEDFLSSQSEEISKELLNWGINLNFAPCIDVNTNPINPIIGERSFSNNPEDVIKGMNIFINASRKNNIIPCVKHFPGHGDASQDSHLTLPTIDLPFEKMEKIHITPFKNAIKNNIEMIMIAHLHCKCFDKENIPASLSQNVIKYLRNTLNYNGIAISDDMYMKGVQSYESIEAVIKGIEAGLDMFIFRESDKKTIDMINKLSKIIMENENLKLKVKISNQRIKKLKNKFHII